MKLLSLALLAVASFEFDARAQVAGFVLDTGGQPVAGARVTLQATNVRTTTANDGSFFLANVPPGFVEIVAAKKGHYNEGQTVVAPAVGIGFRLETVVVANDPNYWIIDPMVCGGCHPDQYAEWYDSPMQKAGTNTWVYDIYDGTGSPGGMNGFVYTRDSVHAASNPASECASCHQPEVWIPQPYIALDPIGNLSSAAVHGISCETCHKLADIDETKTNFPGIWPGAVTLNRPAQPLNVHQVQYGALGDASVNFTGMMRPSYQPQLLAAACAACHQDKNDPDGDGNFEESNGVISEPTYLEWLASPYGDPNSSSYATCVDCHMPPNGATEACVVSPPTRPVGQIRSHRIEGTTARYLENAVDLAMSVTTLTDRVRVDVQVHNRHTGHHVPTGVTVRNMILLVDAWTVGDSQRLPQLAGSTVHALGGVGDPRQGYYAGLPGKLYAKHNHDAQGNGPVFYTDATGINWDNRIAALATDATSYEFALPPAGQTMRVRTRLVYRRSFRSFTDLKNWTTDGHGRPLEDIAAPYFGHLMEETNWQGPGAGAVEPYGPGCRGLVASAAGEPSIGVPGFELVLDGALPQAPAIVLLGFDDRDWAGYRLPLDLTPAGASGCWLLASIDAPEWTMADPSGQARFALPVPHGAPLGATIFVQWAAADPGLPLGIAFSNALAITVQR